MADKYGVLFYPAEEYIERLGNKEDFYFLLRITQTHGIWAVVVQFEKPDGRREICRIGTGDKDGWDDIRDKALAKYREDEDRHASGI